MVAPLITCLQIRHPRMRPAKMKLHPVARAALLLALCLAQAAAFSVPHLGGVRLANRATPLLRTAPRKSVPVWAGRTTVPKSRVFMGILDQVRQALQYGVSLPKRTGCEASAFFSLGLANICNSTSIVCNSTSIGVWLCFDRHIPDRLFPACPLGIYSKDHFALLTPTFVYA